MDRNVTGPDHTLAANDLLRVAPVRQTWKCPTCGAKINLTKCVACVIDQRSKQQGKK
jgi:hypothetical protein